jgi:hypothetical protein
MQALQLPTGSVSVLKAVDMWTLRAIFTRGRTGKANQFIFKKVRMHKQMQTTRAGLLCRLCHCKRRQAVAPAASYSTT